MELMKKNCDNPNLQPNIMNKEISIKKFNPMKKKCSWRKIMA